MPARARRTIATAVSATGTPDEQERAAHHRRLVPRRREEQHRERGAEQVAARVAEIHARGRRVPHEEAERARRRARARASRPNPRARRRSRPRPTATTAVASPSSPSSMFTAFTSTSTSDDAEHDVAGVVRRGHPRRRDPDPDLHDEPHHGREAGRVVGEPQRARRARAGRATTGARAATGPTSPANTATPPRYGIGRACTFNGPGRSTRPSRVASRAATGVATTATTNATIRAIRAAAARRRGAPLRGRRPGTHRVRRPSRRPDCRLR